MGTTGRTGNHSKHLHLIDSRRGCQHCQGEKLCLSFGLSEESIEEFRDIIIEHRPYSAGEVIYRQQDPFRSLFSIQSGAVKTETVTLEGRQSVMGFFLAGDLFGVDAISSSTYPNTAIALETTWLCEVPYRKLLELCMGKQGLQERFIATLGSKIQSDEYSWKVVRNESASRRVMHFLYSLYDRQQNKSDMPLKLRLPMSKQDLASYLGLTPESFSRTLTQLQKDGFIFKESQKVLVLTEEPPARDMRHVHLQNMR